MYGIEPLLEDVAWTRFEVRPFPQAELAAVGAVGVAKITAQGGNFRSILPAVNCVDHVRVLSSTIRTDRPF